MKNQEIRISTKYGGSFSVTGMEVLFLLKMDSNKADTQANNAKKIVISLLLAGF